MISVNPVKSLGQTVYTSIVAALLLIAVAMLAYGQYQSWRSGTWKGRAEQAATAAKVAQGNADSANAGAANASATRTNIDAGTFTVRVETEQSAGRIEAHEPPSAAAVRPADPDILRELADAERQARAAADRLQRARPR